jgi:hypothetical protein
VLAVLQHLKFLHLDVTPGRNNGFVCDHSDHTSSWYGPTLLVSNPVHALTTRPGRPIKNLPESITVNSDESTIQVFQRIAESSGFDINRLRVTKGSDGSPITKSDGVNVHDTGLRNKSAVDVKDLGAYLAPCATNRS